MANIAIDITDWIDEASPSVTSRFRSTGPGTASLDSASPPVEPYFKPSGSEDLAGFTPEEGEEGGGGGGTTPPYPYFG